MLGEINEKTYCKYCKHSYWQQDPCSGRLHYVCLKLHNAVDKYFYCKHFKEKAVQVEGK